MLWHLKLAECKVYAVNQIDVSILAQDDKEMALSALLWSQELYQFQFQEDFSENRGSWYFQAWFCDQEEIAEGYVENCICFLTIYYSSLHNSNVFILI